MRFGVTPNHMWAVYNRTNRCDKVFRLSEKLLKTTKGRPKAAF